MLLLCYVIKRRKPLPFNGFRRFALAILTPLYPHGSTHIIDEKLIDQQLQVTHAVLEVLLFGALVLPCAHAGPGPVDLVRENGITAIYRFLRQFGLILDFPFP